MSANQNHFLGKPASLKNRSLLFRLSAGYVAASLAKQGVIVTKKSLEMIDIGKVQLLLPNVLLHFITKTIQTSENGSFIHSPHSLNLTILLDEKTVVLSVAVLLRGYSRTNIRYDAFFNTSIDIFL